MTITLYKFGPALGQPDASPFCTKVETWLRIAGLDYQPGPFNPKQAPKGKAPYARIDGELVGDSSFIISHLVQTRGVDPDAGLTALQRAQARALQSMLEEHLYFVVVYMRWQVESSWDRYRHDIAGSMAAMGVPKLIVPLVLRSARKGVRKSLHAQGTGRHEEAEVRDIGLALLSACETLLGAGPYVFGESLTTIDASFFAMVAGTLTPELPTPLQQAAAGRFPGLEAYVQRVQAQLF